MQLIIYAMFFISSLMTQSEDHVDYPKLKELESGKQYDSIVNFNERIIIKSNPEKKAQILEIFAKAHEALNDDDKAFNYYKKLKKTYKQKKLYDKVAETNTKIYYLLDSQNKIEIDKADYLKEIKDYAFKTESKKWLMSYYSLYAIDHFNSTSKDTAKKYFQKSLMLASRLDSLESKYKLNINLGALYQSEYQKADSAIYHYKQALELYDQSTELFKSKENNFGLYNNLGNAYRDQQEYKTALKYYTLADNLNLKKFSRQRKKILYANMEANYYYMKDWKNAYDCLYKYDSIEDLINAKEQNVNIVDIEEKYKNQKLRADNLEIESKRLQNRNIAYILGITLALGGIIFYLFYKNAKRRQELKTQKLTSQLKEEELRTIDAMIEGQEKERLRLANDLHDDLGSLMATIKMHFESLKDKRSDKIFNDTHELIEKAYHKIRSIAHVKNSGVMAKDGLFKAVNNLAKSISSSNKVQCHVHKNILKSRLDNSLEIMLFRVVQELVTNVIKHANASVIDIYINQHESHLNIMVEDDGVGFDPDKINKFKSGIGLSSIDTRVNHFGGHMIIESKPNQGTTVIIEIPI